MQLLVQCLVFKKDTNSHLQTSAANTVRLRDPKHVIYITENHIEINVWHDPLCRCCGAFRADADTGSIKPFSFIS